MIEEQDSLDSGNVEPIDKWMLTMTTLSKLFAVDWRITNKAIARVPSKTIGKREFYHIRDAAPAIFRVLWGISEDGEDSQNPEKMRPSDMLDYYKAQREKIKLEQDQRVIIPAIEVETVASETFKAVAQVLETLPDVLERDAALSPAALAIVQRVIDSKREEMYEAVKRLTEEGNAEVTA